MSVAVVFDSAGTLLHTFRIAKNIQTAVLLENVETTMLTFEDGERVLCVLHGHSWDFIKAEPDRLLSEYLETEQVDFGISCTRKVIEKENIRRILKKDRYAKIRDIQECMRVIWSKIKSEEIVALNNGIIVHTGLSAIEFTITAGGTPFPGAKETISALHQMGIFAYIASGDREAKLERMADYLGIPRDRVFGVATPTIKEQIVRDLQNEYDQVIMVGDSINDLRAMRTADIAVLTCQQSSEKPEELIRTADFRIRDLREVLDIVRTITRKIT